MHGRVYLCCVVVRWVDLMAKTITSVSRKEEVTVDGHKMTGADYRYQVVRTLCDMPWPAETAISLLSIIKLVPHSSFHHCLTLGMLTFCLMFILEA